MKKVFLFLADGFEETEAVAALDVMRRGGLDVTSVSISKALMVNGAHNIIVIADQLFDETDFSAGDILVLPGGGPGTDRLNAHEGLKKLLKQYADEGKMLAAICAAPSILGELGLLQGKRATVYPGCEDKLMGAICLTENVVRDGNIITGRSPGAALDFGLSIVEALTNAEKAKSVEIALIK